MVERVVGISVDVDGWDTCLRFYGTDIDAEDADKEVNCGLGIRRLLSLFKENSIKATFFLVGNTIERFKQDARMIKKDGHEIGCHSMSHNKLDSENFELIEKEVSRSDKTIKRLLGSKCLGFRAPAFSISNELLDVLESYKFKYDSSLIPTYIPGEYGNLFSPMRPYRPSKNNFRKTGDRNIIELPLAVNPILPIPLGAPFIRNFGSWWTKIGLKMLWSRGIPAILYIHPKDVVKVPENSKVPWYIKRNSGGECIKRLDSIIKFCEENGAKILTLDEISDMHL